MAGAKTLASPGRSSCQRLLLAAGLLLICGATQATETARPLRYRTALFYYFQQDYFATLTELMTAQQLDLPGAFADHAELLRAGASLSYGLENDAAQVFEALLSEPGASADRDRAWFYLGKLAWQKGALDRCESDLDKMAPTYHGELAPQANYLRASISLRRGDKQLAASYDTLLPLDSPWLYYPYYNLGASYAAGQDWSAAVDYFARIEQSPLTTPEMTALRDKALTASGYAQLAAKQFEQAAISFSKVRLDSPLVERALLGYGWAYSGMADYRSAITPWQTLAGRSLLNDSVREALLALPHAHEHLGRWRTALGQYRHAGAVYEAELAKVLAAIEVLRDGDLTLQPGLGGVTAQDWLNADHILPPGEQLPYLHHLMTEHTFRLAMRELQDLQATAHFLSGASGRLQALSAKEPDHTTRIGDLQTRLHLQERQVQDSLLDAQSRIRSLAITELERQATSLQRALGQSRLAVARLYDTAGAGAQR